MKSIAYISIAGIGVIGAIPISYVVYDKNNPTVASILEKQGYTFNEPKFINEDRISQDCYKNLFKESVDNTDTSKVYGCAIMRMYQSVDKKHIQFNSEISIQKENKGWILNTKIINTKKNDTSGKSYAAYIITPLKRENNKWLYGRDSEIDNHNSYVLFQEISNNQITIKANGEEWFNNSLNSESHNSPNYLITKEYKGVWISDNNSGSDDWIFKNFEVSIKNQKLWFDKNFSTIPSEFTKNIITNSDIKLGFDSAVHSSTSNNNHANKITELINAIKDVKGKWMNLKDICSFGNQRVINEENTKKLKIFCSSKDKRFDLTESE